MAKGQIRVQVGSKVIAPNTPEGKSSTVKAFELVKSGLRGRPVTMATVVSRVGNQQIKGSFRLNELTLVEA